MALADLLSALLAGGCLPLLEAVIVLFSILVSVEAVVLV